MATKIEWATDTINPIAGCMKCSPECQHCYAEGMSARLARMDQTRDKYAPVVTGGRFNGKVTWSPGVLAKLAAWKHPRTVFVESMGDLFMGEVYGDWIAQVLDACAASPQHQYLFLTKRPGRMVMHAGAWVRRRGNQYVPSNWHFGVTAGTQESADRRIPALLAMRKFAPDSVLFVSGEPLLEDVDWSRFMHINPGATCVTSYYGREPSPVKYRRLVDDAFLEAGPRIDALFIGCESGPKRRHTDLAWIRHSIAQATASGIPIMVKQAEINGVLVKLPEVDGRVWNELPPALAGKVGA